MPGENLTNMETEYDCIDDEREEECGMCGSTFTHADNAGSGPYCEGCMDSNE
jgi:hypothetical protein